MSAGASTTLGRTQAQSGRTQSTYELAALDLDGTCSDDLVAMLLRDVVVVALKHPPRNAQFGSEVVQLVV